MLSSCLSHDNWLVYLMFRPFLIKYLRVRGWSKKTRNDEKHFVLSAWQNRDGARAKLLILDIYNQNFLKPLCVCMCDISVQRVRETPKISTKKNLD